MMHSRNGMSYGVGSITDGKKKVTVQVSCFTESSFETGDHVTINEVVKEQGYYFKKKFTILKKILFTTMSSFHVLLVVIPIYCIYITFWFFFRIHNNNRL